MYWFSHSVGPVTQAQIAMAKGGRRATPDDVLTLIPVLDPITQEKLWLLVQSKAQH
jgi:hypothetical protein